MRWNSGLVCFGGVALVTSVAAARDLPAPQRSPMIAALERCKQLSDPAQRLACYDSAAGALVQAANSGQVRVVDRAQIQQAKRSLFGFSMPKLSIFSGDRADDTSDKLETTVKSVTQLNTGRYRIVLTEGGAIWETTEDKMSFDPPKKGQKIVITRGPFGSYFIQVNGQIGVRGHRVG